MTPDPVYFPGATPRDLLAGVLDWTDRHPDDPRLPEVLLAAIRRTLTAPTPDPGDGTPWGDGGQDHTPAERAAGQCGPAGLTAERLAEIRAAYKPVYAFDSTARAIVQELLAAHDALAVRLAEVERARDEAHGRFEVEETRRGILGNMLRYVAFVLAGDEAADAQVAADETKARLETAEQRAAVLAGALKQYGQHTVACQQQSVHVCACGLDARLAPPQAAAGPADGGRR